MRPWRSSTLGKRARPSSSSFATSSSGRMDALLPWVPVLVGVGVMIGLLIAALALSPGSATTTANGSVSQSPIGPPDQGQALGSSDGLGAGQVSPSDPLTSPATMSGSVAPSRTPGGSAAGERGNGGSGAGVTPSAQAPVVTVVSGRYRVLNSYVDSFIGEVLVSNSSSSSRDWSVRLQFPSNVGSLRTSWVESQPQATLTRSGETFIWTSTVPVNAGSSVALRFQFDRSGTNSNPATCTVNGASCSGL
jgi:hypothetical protein